MPSPEAGCRYSSGLTRCKRPTIVFGHCVFHCAKPSHEEEESGHYSAFREKLREAAERFPREFEQLLTNVEYNPAIQEYDLSGFRFLPDQPLDWTQRSFEKPVLLNHAEFKSDVSCFRTQFRARAEFDEAIFHGRADFRQAGFSGFATFSSVSFAARASFLESRFEGQCRFTVAKLHESDFSGATFCGPTTFSGTKFSESAEFHSTVFQAKTDFSWSTFAAHSSFVRTSFQKDVDFGRATIGGHVRFVGDQECHVFLAGCGFNNVKKEGDGAGAVLFEAVDLSRATFCGTNLEGIDFRSVRWHQIRHVGWGTRRALFDEVRQAERGKTPNYDRLAENYSQLVLNYEKRREFDASEDFHIGEMEVRRRREGANTRFGPWRFVREWFNMAALYRIFSFYGTNYRLAFAWLMIWVLLAFPTVFMFSGFQSSKESVGGVANYIHYDFFSHPNTVRPGFATVASDYLDAVLFVLSILTYQRERFYEPVGGWSRFWIVVAALVLTAQAALTLLAVRRRFKR